MNEDYTSDSEGLAKRWGEEIDHSKKMLRKFWKRGDKCVDKFKDKRDENSQDEFRLNLYNSNVTTLRSMLFGRTPQVDVSRRYADADDDTARVASSILSRVLNNDVEESDDNFNAVLRNCLTDRLIPGLGTGRARYELQTVEREIDPILEGEEPEVEEIIVSEESVVDYVHWKDFLWGYARTWSEVPWVAFRSYLKKDEAKERFGGKKANQLEYKTRKSPEESKDEVDNWEKARVWEIWNKEDRKVYWWSRGCDDILDVTDDPYELTNFFPCPRPMVANITTSLFEPVPDYYLAQDLYKEIDSLETRINILTKAVKAVGVYDSGNRAVKRMLNEGVENDLIPVENWSGFAEKGGLQGVVDWMPIHDIVKSLEVLRGLRDEAIRLLYQVTGLSDILRGAATEASRVSATEQSLKAKFGSVRIQALQDEFSLFASELAALKAEIIARHFSDKTILRQSNILRSSDKEHAMNAVNLIKDNYENSWRVAIRSESVAMVDYAQLQAERTEYINALAVFMQSSAPLVQLDGSITPYLLELLKWGLAGFKGSNEIESVIDKAVDQLQKPKQPQPSEEEIKAQMEMQKEKFKHATDMAEEQQRHINKMKEMGAEHQHNIVEDIVETNLEMEKEEEKTAQQRYLQSVKNNA